MTEKNIAENKTKTMTKGEKLDELLKQRYAHRGLHQKPVVPENSMAAFQRAAEEGFGIELDIHLTGDGKLAVIHDSSLKRTCGADLHIEDITLEDAKMHFLENSRERIPEFAEVLELVAGRVPLIVELKAAKTEDGEDTTEKLCQTAAAALDTYTSSYEGKAGTAPVLFCVESFSPAAVKWFRRNRPDIIRGQLAANLNKQEKVLPYFQDFLLKNLIINRSGRPDFVAYNFDDRDESALRRYDGPLFFWTIRKYEDLKEAEEMGAAAIFERFNPKEYE